MAKNKIPNKKIDEVTKGKKVRQGQKPKKDGTMSKGREQKISTAVDKSRKDGGMKNPRRDLGYEVGSDELINQLMATLGMSPDVSQGASMANRNPEAAAYADAGGRSLAAGRVPDQILQQIMGAQSGPAPSGIPLDQRMRNAGTVPSNNVEDVRGQVLEQVLGPNSGPVRGGMLTPTAEDTMTSVNRQAMQKQLQEMPELADMFIERYGYEPDGANPKDFELLEAIVNEIEGVSSYGDE